MRCIKCGRALTEFQDTVQTRCDCLKSVQDTSRAVAFQSLSKKYEKVHDAVIVKFSPLLQLGREVNIFVESPDNTNGQKVRMYGTLRICSDPLFCWEVADGKNYFRFNSWEVRSVNSMGPDYEYTIIELRQLSKEDIV